MGLTALLLAISRGQHWGWTSVPTLGLALLAVMPLTLWPPWERRHPAPLIDFRAAMRAPIPPINVASFFATFGMYANHLPTTQKALAPAPTRYGLATPTAAARLFLLPSAVPMILLASVAARVITRFGGQPSSPAYSSAVEPCPCWSARHWSAPVWPSPSPRCRL